MSQTHTIVVRFPEGIVPRYSAATEFQGGQVVAVNFGGDQLEIAQEMEELLERCRLQLDWLDDEHPLMTDIHSALARAREVKP